MTCKQCEICKSVKQKKPSEKTMKAIEEAKRIVKMFEESDRSNGGLDLRNAIVAAYVQSYESGICFDSREEMLEELVVALTKELKYAEEQLAIGD